MHISKAALPPIQPRTNDADRTHPDFPAYQLYRSGMSNNLLEADGFRSWLHSRTFYAKLEEWVSHPEYPAFRAWMWDNQGGDKKRCNLQFPENFKAWLSGQRW